MSETLVSDLRYLSRFYRKVSLGSQLHVWGRRILCPLDQVVRNIPLDGVHLDVGCGHGALLALLHRRCPNQVLIGIDIAHDKIHRARQSEVENVTFKIEPLEQIPSDSVDSISVVDVLYLIPLEKKQRFLQSCASALRPGGYFILKETAKEPLWKYIILLFQEFLAVKILRFTQGSNIKIAPVHDIQKFLIQSGFVELSATRIDHGYPYPHFCFVARKTKEPCDLGK